MSEPVTIILLTYERTEYAVRTIRALRQNLRYPHVSWFVADDGSRPEHVQTVLDELSGVELLGWHSQRSSYGAIANVALRSAREYSSLSLWIEDDWELLQPLDLWSYAALLMEESSIGMVRMGYLNAGIKGETFGHRGQMYWKLDPESPYIFAGHPSLRHMRFHDFAGDYPERLQPGETELSMAWKYKLSFGPTIGPSIVYPCLLGQQGPFGHIGEVQSYIWNGGRILASDESE